jgi:hypothetical protein
LHDLLPDEGNEPSSDQNWLQREKGRQWLLSRKTIVYNYKTLAKKTNPPPNEVASYFTSFEATLRQQQSEGDNRELKRRTSEASDQDAMSCAQRICL